jgi:hypothetical protein
METNDFINSEQNMNPKAYLETIDKKLDNLNN